MMNITVKLFANFRVGRFKEAQRNYPNNTPCRLVLQELYITEEELGVLMVNSRHADLDHELKDGDIVSIFPLVGGG
ncbi:MoaD/ThiS family protein [uncultured Desulfuromonas sp.]|uniref:MoaD/ThiS family protein n=1 Tax=uncultured Desulfuromonas sp. TaxID=181013 RepID=UPI002AAB93B6|nr:MoaD/ThiS family protein [uncultured Desulfuromonas sp.]